MKPNVEIAARTVLFALGAYRRATCVENTQALSAPRSVVLRFELSPILWPRFLNVGEWPFFVFSLLYSR